MRLIWILPLALLCVAASNYSKMEYKDMNGNPVVYPPVEEPAYKYMDSKGNEVLLPMHKTIYNKANPGPWKDVKDGHEFIMIKSRIREIGLEDVRILDIRFEHPMEEDNRLLGIFLTDKDNYIIGNYAFPKGDPDTQAQIRINGNVNYVQVYVECSKHGMWRSELRF